MIVVMGKHQGVTGLIFGKLIFFENSQFLSQLIVMFLHLQMI